MIKELHQRFVQGRQREVLSCLIRDAILAGAGGSSVHTVLDVGCGDGVLGKMVSEKIGGGCKVQGVDVAVRKNPAITVDKFDGLHLPFEDSSVDVVVISDVLHHVPSEKGQFTLFSECCRVAKIGVVVKDHVEKWLPDRMILVAMDLVGNFFHGVPSPGNYITPQGWDRLYAESGVVSSWRKGSPLGIHGAGVSWLTEKTPWGSELQFVEFLRKN